MYDRELFAKIKPVMDMYSVDPKYTVGTMADKKDIINGVAKFLSGLYDRKNIIDKYLKCILDYYEDLTNAIFTQHKALPYTNGKYLDYNKMVECRLKKETLLLFKHANIIYLPMIFELSDGCSVQCPFCAIDAPYLTENYPYNYETSSLWKNILKISKEVLGPAAGLSVCYLATEPFDNPDYEKFVMDFISIFGVVPQTTTAIGEKNPDRIRAFRQMIGEDAVRKNALRFSVRNIEQYRAIKEAYSDEELLDIEFLANNVESCSAWSKSGRARKLSKEALGSKRTVDYTIVCLAGIKVNMVRKTLEWIEPVKPSDKYPDGYKLLEKQIFDDKESFRDGILNLIENNAVSEIIPGRKFMLNPYIAVDRSGNTVSFKSEVKTLSLSGNDDFLNAVSLIKDSSVTFEELTDKLFMSDYPASILKEKLNIMLKRGYLVYE